MACNDVVLYLPFYMSGGSRTSRRRGGGAGGRGQDQHATTDPSQPLIGQTLAGRRNTEWKLLFEVVITAVWTERYLRIGRKHRHGHHVIVKSQGPSGSMSISGCLPRDYR
jgi:hypothetical protein